MAKQVQAGEEKLGLISQTQAEYQEIRGYCQKVRGSRQQADS
ncbi:MULTISPECIES: hypothetical protein [Paenibacillus]|nr:MULTISPECIES: hypothetical protein [Paenibacillus]MDQ0046924.1 hypothetical protein [Paenibacillus polymyxa]MDY8024487.1 hypothetical protein [Paenibacillus polymyxa]